VVRACAGFADTAKGEGRHGSVHVSVVYGRSTRCDVVKNLKRCQLLTKA
jgi:hypothetical protein